MNSRHSLLPIAVSLAVCLWVSVATAQAGTMAPAASEESQPAVYADVATRDTGEPPGTGELPGTGDRPDTKERPGAVQPAAGTVLDPAASLRRRALAAMETLREEIATLTALKSAQAALLAWNRGRTEANEGPRNPRRRVLQRPGARTLVPAAAGHLRHKGTPWNRGTPWHRGTPWYPAHPFGWLHGGRP